MHWRCNDDQADVFDVLEEVDDGLSALVSRRFGGGAVVHGDHQRTADGEEQGMGVHTRESGVCVLFFRTGSPGIPAVCMMQVMRAGCFLVASGSWYER